MMDICWTYCGKYDIVSQIIMLYILNLYSLYVNYISIKLEEKRKVYAAPQKKYLF